MKRVTLRTIALPLLGLLSACEANPFDVYLDRAPFVEIGAFSYSMTTDPFGVIETEIPFAFKNNTDQDLYLEICGRLVPPTLERKSGSEWKAAWRAPDYNCDPTPYTLAPGASWTDVLHVFAHPFGGERGPQFLTKDVTGTYRLVLPHVWVTWNRKFTSRPFGEELPVELRVSDPFELEAPTS